MAKGFVGWMALLCLGAVRERTATYTSYDVTFRSTTAGAGTAPLRISGVLNVPTGRGPQGGQGWPAVVLAAVTAVTALVAVVAGEDLLAAGGEIGQRLQRILHPRLCWSLRVQQL